MAQLPIARGWRQYEEDAGLGVVLDAALEVFSGYGYHGTTVRMIAAEAGLSVPGLYYHAASKQELLVALLRHSEEDILRRARQALTDAGDAPRRRFVHFVENLVLYTIHRRRLAHLAREARFLEQPQRQTHLARRTRLQAMLRKEVAAGAQAGTFQVEDPREATRAVVLLCRGVAEWHASNGRSAAAEQITRRCVRLALALVGDTQERAIGPSPRPLTAPGPAPAPPRRGRRA